MADFPLAQPTTGSTGWDTAVNNNFNILSKTAAKAWVNFDGTGTVAIRSAYNVSSVGDNGTGDYSVNFTVAMPDANYCALFGSQGNYPATDYSIRGFWTPNDTGSYAAGSLRIRYQEVNSGSQAAKDPLTGCAAVLHN